MVPNRGNRIFAYLGIPLDLKLVCLSGQGLYQIGGRSLFRNSPGERRPALDSKKRGVCSRLDRDNLRMIQRCNEVCLEGIRYNLNSTVRGDRNRSRRGHIAVDVLFRSLDPYSSI